MFKTILKWFLLGLGVLVAGWIAYGAIYYTLTKDKYTVSSESMSPALMMGDVIRVDHDAYRTRKPEAGEIVIAEINEGNQTHKLVFRVVALPGDKVQFLDGKLFVNERPVTAQLANRTDEFEDYTETMGSRSFTVRYLRLDTATHKMNQPMQMRDGDYFLAGDNRDNASDSRYWGPTQLSSIRGRVVKITDSIDKSRIGKEL